MPLSVGMLPKLTEVIYTERVSKVGFFIALDYPLGTKDLKDTRDIKDTNCYYSQLESLMSLWSFKVHQVLNVFRFSSIGILFLTKFKMKAKSSLQPSIHFLVKSVGFNRQIDTNSSDCTKFLMVWKISEALFMVFLSLFSFWRRSNWNTMKFIFISIKTWLLMI